jgi:hypothetical protein
MKLTALLTISSAFLVGAMVATGCSDDDEVATAPDAGYPDVTAPDTGTGTDAGPQKPAAPTLGAQIDRMGRPAINTALNHTFDPDAGAAGFEKNAYNADSNQAGWAAKYKDHFKANLAVYDSLDNNCGNQILAGDAGQANTYEGLATVLADDRLWLNTGSTTCTTYLGVELNATNKIPNTDCGGRAPSYDTIDVTYSALAIGAPSGVGDGIAKDATKTDGTAFPYLAAPK